jgi:hypothetical protein
MTRSVLACLVVVAACVEAPTPAVSSVEPNVGSRTARTAVRIFGSSLYPAYDADYDGESEVDAGFAAWLGETPLLEVGWVSSTELTALVPAGLPLGPHELRVDLPDSRHVRLRDAFLVMDGDAGPARRIEIVSMQPGALTTNGLEQADIIARVTDHAGQGVPGEVVTFAVSSGTLDAVEGLPDGRYRVRYTAPSEPGSGEARVTATCLAASDNPQDTASLRLVATCTNADYEVASYADLAAAVVAANTAVSHGDLCISADSNIILGQTLVLSGSFGTTLRGEARVIVSGFALGEDEHGIDIVSAGNRIENIHFQTFDEWAVQIDGSGNTLARNRFSGGGGAVLVSGSNNTLGPDNEIDGVTERGFELEGQGATVTHNYFHDGPGAAAIEIGVGDSPGGIVIRRNLFVRLRSAIELEDGDGARVDGNTFIDLSDPAVTISPVVVGVRMRNNLFSQNDAGAVVGATASFSEAPDHNLFHESAPACACSLGAQNYSFEPRFVAPERDRFSLSLDSECVDAGVDVGEFDYLGTAPDLGALELR